MAPRILLIRCSALLFALLVVLGPGTAPVASAAPRNAVQGWLEQIHRSGVPALAVVVTRGNEVEIASAAGQVDGKAADRHTRFRIESLAKSFTATAVLQLVADGSVDLDGPVIRYLPELSIDDPRAARITVRQLLNQSTGLTDATLGFDQYAPGPRTAREGVTQLSASHLAFDPGSEGAYCNPNFWIAARLVEVISGQSFATYLREQIFAPLGMDETTSAPTEHGLVAATGHAAVFGTPLAITAPDALVEGSGGIASSAHDLGIWLRFQNGALPGADEVLPGRWRAEMHRRQAPQGGLYALGWYSGPPADGGVERVSHSGVGAGVGAYHGLFPDEVGIAVLQSASAPDPYAIAAPLYAASTGASLGPAPTAPGAARDLILGLTSLVVVALSLRGIVRSRRWAGRRAPVRSALSTVACSVAAIAAVTVPIWGSALAGRSATWPVLFASAPVPVVGILLGGASLGALVIARLGQLVAVRE